MYILSSEYVRERHFAIHFAHGIRFYLTDGRRQEGTRTTTISRSVSSELTAPQRLPNGSPMAPQTDPQAVPRAVRNLQQKHPSLFIVFLSSPLTFNLSTMPVR